MLRLSKKTDYALMAMKHLAADPGRRAASAREIAEKYDIPVDLMGKVLTRLVRSGLLISHQGIHGGYQLAQPPAATSTYVPVLVSYARTARSRNATGYGFGMHAVDHDRIPNSSELWG